MGTIAEQLAEFTEAFTYDAVPDNVKAQARHLILNAVGLAFAASTFDFAHKTVSSMASFGAGDSVVIGMPIKLSLRDAVLVNGSLIHGLDFDDSHLVGTIHPSASCFPTALAVAACTNASAADMVAAYVLGLEISIRLAALGKGQFNQIGFHPTGMIAAFGCALIAGKLYGLSREQLTMAQGIVLSMASGVREYSTNSSGSKRLHPGWAGVSGITAAVLARGGVTGPRTTYEGRFGLYATHLNPKIKLDDLAGATAELGSRWETQESLAIKPFPVGQLNIPFIEGAVAIAKKHNIKAADIESVEALVAPNAIAIVCEPVAARKRPVDRYGAQFSIQFAIACGLIRRKFGLEELERYGDPELLAIADKVEYRIDPNAPSHGHSGELIVHLRNGQTWKHREEHPLGAPEKPLTRDQVVEKFMGNAQMAMSESRAQAIRDEILGLDKTGRARDLAQRLSAL